MLPLFCWLPSRVSILFNLSIINSSLLLNMRKKFNKWNDVEAFFSILIHELCYILCTWLGHLRFFWISWAVWCGRLQTDSESLQIQSRCSHYKGEAALAGFSSPCCFQTCLTAFRCLHGLAPGYLAGSCIPVSSVPGRSHLRSAALGARVIPSSRLVTVGERAFVVTCPRAWNLLPPDLRTADLGLQAFRKRLKTFPFQFPFLVPHWLSAYRIPVYFLLTMFWDLFMKACKIVYNNNNNNNTYSPILWIDGENEKKISSNRKFNWWFCRIPSDFNCIWIAKLFEWISERILNGFIFAKAIINILC